MEGQNGEGTIGIEEVKRGRGRPRKYDSPADPSTGTSGTEETGRNDTAEIQVIGSQVSGVAGISIPQPNDAPKKRGRPKGKGKKSTAQVDRKTAQQMVKATFAVGMGIAAGRLGEHWKLTDHEAESLAEPIANLLERYDLLKIVGTYGDWIALFIALGMVFTPRVMMSGQIKKMKNGGVQVGTIQKPTIIHGGKQPSGSHSTGGNQTIPHAAPAAGSSTGVQGQATVPHANDVKSILADVIG